MKISYNWLKKYIAVDKSPEELAITLTNTGLEVEDIHVYESVKGSLEGLVVGYVNSCTQHPNADKLKLTKVTTDGTNELSIVCGAPNVAAGQKVIVATVGTTVYPLSSEPFTINKSKIRGEVSEGMLCAEDEIGLGKSHDGILILPENSVIGTKIADIFKIEKDSVFEIGITPNRSDALSHIGVAKDVAAALGGCITYPIIKALPEINKGHNVAIQIADSEACFNYSGLVIKGVNIATSPDWLQNALKAIGLKPVNNVVDVTNYVMMEMGQPLHAFDLSKIVGDTIIVRNAYHKEKLVLLDSTEKTLTAQDLVIANTDHAMALAGVMGGLHDSITQETRNIFLESATFNPVWVRKTAKYHNLKTDASYRFERGTDQSIVAKALARCAQLIVDVAGGEIGSNLLQQEPKPQVPKTVALDLNFLRKFVGKPIDDASIEAILTRLEFVIESKTGTSLLLTVPTYRVDVERDVDVAEEFLRIYGFNNIHTDGRIAYSPGYPLRNTANDWQEAISDQLASTGFYEIMSLSFTKASNATHLHLPPEQAIIALANPLSEDLSIMRPSLVFGGLDSIVYNINRRQKDLKLFELGKSYLMHGDKKVEERTFALWITGNTLPQASWLQNTTKQSIYHLIGQVEGVLNRMGIADFQTQDLELAYYSQALALVKGNKIIAKIGQLATSILQAFDIKQEVFYAEINWDYALKLSDKVQIKYSELNKYPAVNRDLALIVDEEVTFAQIKEMALRTEKLLLQSVNVFDVYNGDKIEKGKKSYAINFVLQDQAQTLTDKQVDKTMNKLIETFKRQLNAELRA